MVMRMEEGLDTGPVALMAMIAIGTEMNAGELHDQMALRGADLMAEALEKLQAGKLQFAPQKKEGATYAKKIDKADLRIDFARRAEQVHNQVRALSPIPGAFGLISDGRGTVRLKLLRTKIVEGNGAPGEIIGDDFTIACQSGAVRVLDVQREGGKPLKVADFLRGAERSGGPAVYIERVSL